MGKTFDALFGRRSSKLSTNLEHAISRTALLKNRQHALFSFSHSDIVQLLNLGYEEQALLRVEHVMKSKNMLDALEMIESYCHLLLQELSLIERSRECPNELKEATSSLIFVSSRIGDFPELQHIRDFFALKFGKEYTSQVLEFPRYLGVNDKIIEMVSKRKPSLENRMGFLQEIASENGITLHLDVKVQQRGQQGQISNQTKPLARSSGVFL